MAKILPDDIDWAAYERDTTAKVKVREASAWAADLVRSFQPQHDGPRLPEMFSTKLRGRLEFRPSEVTVWAGYSGHRKSMFTGQVALDLCVQRQRVLIASMEMRPVNTLARMARQCYGVAVPLAQQLEHFSRWTDGRLWLFDHMGRLSPREALAVIRYFATELQGQHIVLDSMMMVCQSEERLDEQKQFGTDLVRIAQELGVHVHLVAHCRKPQDDSKPPTKYDLRGSVSVSDQVDNVVTVWANKPKERKLEENPFDTVAQAEPDARISVEKQRNGEFEGAVKLWWHKGSMRFADDRASRLEPYAMAADAPRKGGYEQDD